MAEDYSLRGLHKVSWTLKDGTKTTYYYAWRGGPPMVSEDGSRPSYGSVAFLELFRRLTEKDAARAPTFAGIIDEYELSSDFLGRAEKTRKDYARYLKMIREKHGKLPLELFASPKIRGHFKKWRDGMADKPRTADYAWTVLAKLCAFAVDRGELASNPCVRGGRLYAADRNEKIWGEDTLLRLFGAASPEVTAVVTMALWTGQRQADCLKVRWDDLDVGKIRVRQNKGKRKLMIPMGAPLAELIGAMPRRAATILTNSRGETWTGDGFRSSYSTAFQRAGIVDDLHFHDLRGTAITRMGLAGCTALQIAAVTGHSSKTIDEMLQAHYLGGQAELAEQAINMLEVARG